MTHSADKAIFEFGAVVLEKHLAAMRQEAGGVRLGKDIEAIHRMRVASRRLRAALPLFAGFFPRPLQKIWGKEIPLITRALGEARDTDVQIECLEQILAQKPGPRLAPGIQRVVLRLAQRRAILQENVVAALDELETSTALNPFRSASEVPPAPEIPLQPYDRAIYQQASRAVQQKLAAFLAFEPFVYHPEAKEQLHAMRIAAKRLRYNLETFTPLYAETAKSFTQAAKTAQELLGGIHDCDVWLDFLPGFITGEKQRILDFYGHTRPLLPLLPGLNYLVENRRLERQRLYEEFVSTWEKWNTDLTWQNLVETVSLPVKLFSSTPLNPPPAWQSEVSPTVED